jgi:DNA-binding transcriptional MocR family regulator
MAEHSNRLERPQELVAMELAYGVARAESRRLYNEGKFFLAMGHWRGAARLREEIKDYCFKHEIYPRI